MFLPVLIVGGYLTNELRKVAIQEAEEQQSANLERVKDRLMELFVVPIELSNHVMVDYRLENIINQEYESVYQVVDEYWKYQTLRDYVRMYNTEISNLRFYTDNSTLLNNWEIIPLTEEIAKEHWYKQAMANPGSLNWQYIEDETKNNQHFLSLVRRIDFTPFHTSGVLVVNVNPNTLHTIVSQETSLVMLVDDNQNIISSNNNNQIGKKLNKYIQLKEVLAGKIGSFQELNGGDARRVYVQEVPLQNTNNQLRIISVVDEDKIISNAKYFGEMGIILISITISFALIIIYIVSRLLSSRLVFLSKKIKEVSQGNFNVRTIIDGEDEIGILSRHLDSMIRNTKELINKVNKTNQQKSLLERRQSEMKFKMLASQINPHFLFNSLESLRMEAHSIGAEELANTIKSLGKFIRNNLEVTSEQITLEQELELVKLYLEIQKFRFDNRLRYVFRVDPDSLETLIPPLIIQPLVENSVIHGLEGLMEGGVVEVKIELNQHILDVKVTDNGVGMDEQTLVQIQTMMNEEDEEKVTRLGLRNIHQRLQIIYGNKSGLRISSKQGEGTSISFSVKVGGESIV